MSSTPTATVQALAALPQPYLLFLGDTTEAGFAKTAIVGNIYGDAAPDIATIVDNVPTISDTLVDQRQNLTNALLATTGLAPDQGSFYVTVDGVTAQDPQWWSLWTASVDNGELGEWAFAQVGAADLEPEAGQIVGWRLLEDYNKPQEAPQYDPLTDAPGAATPASSASGDTSRRANPCHTGRSQRSRSESGWLPQAL